MNFEIIFSAIFCPQVLIIKFKNLRAFFCGDRITSFIGECSVGTDFARSR